jgi:CBS domain-containing protein
MNDPIANVLARKGNDVVTVAPETTVLIAVQQMNDRKIGALLVLERGRPVGIFTERDVLRLYAEGDRDFDSLAVEARMTCSVMFGRLSMSVDEALGLMTEGRFRHLPVVEGDKLLGLVSIGDLVKVKLNETAEEAQALRAYIAT